MIDLVVGAVGNCGEGNGTMADAQAARWLDKPEEHDYPAAASYLALLAAPAEVERLVREPAAIWALDADLAGSVMHAPRTLL